MTDGPLAAYRARLASGGLKPDPAQGLAAEKLQSLHHALQHYRPSLGQTGWRDRFGLGRRKYEPQPPQGLYIFGHVGRGKSMLMDLFHESTTVEAKRRVHFHEFMRDVHKELNVLRKAQEDPIPRLARRIALESWLLCLDELQIGDIADAMVVGRLFQALFDNGVVIVTTSNRAPDDLYKDGLQRERFLPFIALINQRLDLLELNSERDYRLGRKLGLRVYHTPMGGHDWDADACFAQMTGGQVPQRDALTVHDRRLEVPATADGVARFTFEELCGRALGPSDYLALATHYHTMILTGVPVMGPDMRNEARRFVTLIDALYEHKVTLVCSAAAPPPLLYPEGDGHFEFQRTVSRLIEMQSATYLRQEHLT
ncbi:MAG: AFG1 family ATPase [Alphaproteobacteria bacterium]|nr:AFG1 family ATPase [Alphaproteobacteria bacterium]